VCCATNKDLNLLNVSRAYQETGGFLIFRSNDSNNILILQVPNGREGKANLRICGNCHLTSGFRFQNSTAVTIVVKGSSAFIQTDKPVYKPSQTGMP